MDEDGLLTQLIHAPPPRRFPILEHILHNCKHIQTPLRWIDPLAAVLTDPNRDVAVAALQILLHLLPPLAVSASHRVYLHPIFPSLIHLLGDDYVAIRKSALQCLSVYVKAARDLRVLTDAIIRSGLKHEDWKVRQGSSLAVVALIPSKEIAPDWKLLVESLVVLLTDEAEKVVVSSVQALAHFRFLLRDSFDQIIKGLPSALQQAYMVHREKIVIKSERSFIRDAKVPPSSASSASSISTISTGSEHIRTLKPKEPIITIAANGLAFGLFDIQLIHNIVEAVNWQHRLTAVTELEEILRSMPDLASLLPYLGAFIRFLSPLVCDPNSRVSISSLDIVCDVVNKTGAMMSSHIDVLIPNLIEKLTDQRVPSKQALMRVFHGLMRNLSPKLVVSKLADAKEHPNRIVREEVVSLLVYSLIVFKRGEHDCHQTCAIASTFLESDRSRVTFLVMEVFFLANKIMGPQFISQMPPMHDVYARMLQERLHIPQIPVIDIHGLVDYPHLQGIQVPTGPVDSDEPNPVSKAIDATQTPASTSKASKIPWEMSTRGNRGSRARSAVKRTEDGDEASVQGRKPNLHVNTEGNESEWTNNHQLAGVQLPSSPGWIDADNADGKVFRDSTEEFSAIAAKARQVQHGGFKGASPRGSNMSPTDASTNRRRVVAKPSEGNSSQSHLESFKGLPDELQIHNQAVGTNDGVFQQPAPKAKRRSAPPRRDASEGYNSDERRSNGVERGVRLDFDEASKAVEAAHERPQAGPNLIRQDQQEEYDSDQRQTDAAKARQAKGRATKPKQRDQASDVASNADSAASTNASPESSFKSAGGQDGSSSRNSSFGKQHGSSSKPGSIRQILDGSIKAAEDVQLEDLRPFDNPDSEFKKAMNDLSSSEWNVVVEAITSMRRLMMFHCDQTISQQIHAVVLKLQAAVENLRSSVSKYALTAVSDLFRSVRKSLDSELDSLVPLLLKKTGESNVFIVEEAEKALFSACDNTTESKLLLCLMANGQHKNTQIRGRVAQFMYKTIDNMGSRALTLRDIDKVLVSLAQLLNDGNADARTHSRNALLCIWGRTDDVEFDRMLKKALPESSYGNTKEALAKAKAKGVDLNPDSSFKKRNPAAKVASRPNQESAPLVNSFSIRNEENSEGSSEAVGPQQGGKSSPTNPAPQPRRSASKGGRNASQGKVVRLPAEFDGLPAILQQMVSNDWKTKNDALNSVLDLMTRYPDECVYKIIPIFDGLVPRISDANTKVSTNALTVVQKVVALLKDNIEPVLSNLIPALANNLAASNAQIRALASETLDNLLATVDPVILLPPLVNAATFGNLRVKPQLLDKIRGVIPTVHNKKPTMVCKSIVPLCFGLVEEGKSEIKAVNVRLMQTLREV
eukprot:TRINITY_DN7695_c0_g1_i4.p1 TRINITY_DN7695_c0_g1~~TRINITY_DN7695_c0_g1_i4.p1  ORF type:complete len:1373 (-),score=287.02 TRINITY_DN7695_c0_g1_i4:153-4271(-)